MTADSIRTKKSREKRKEEEMEMFIIESVSIRFFSITFEVITTD
jgi:hypothetical protein